MATATKVELLVPVKDGRLNPTDFHKKVIGDFLRARGDKPVVLRLSKQTNTRSQRQNRYLWGCCYQLIAEATGNTTEDIHIALKDILLPRRFITVGGKELEVRKSTAELSTADFEKYLEALRAWAASEAGIQIPLPNE